MNIINTTDLTTIDGIKEAITANATNKVMVGILEALLKAKQREIELIEKAAKKTSSRTGFTVGESIAKALFVALRPHVADDGIALRAYKAGIKTLTDDDNIDVDLQKKIFSSSTWHCAKSNFNKCVDISTAYNSYRESVKQAKVLLPFIEQGTWSDWEKAIIKAAKAAAAKRGETWLTPAEQAIKDAEQAEQADNKGTEQADNKGTEQADDTKTDDTKTDDTKTDDTKKVIITTTSRKRNGKK